MKKLTTFVLILTTAVLSFAVCDFPEWGDANSPANVPHHFSPPTFFSAIHPPPAFFSPTHPSLRFFSLACTRKCTSLPFPSLLTIHHRHRCRRSSTRRLRMSFYRFVLTRFRGLVCFGVACVSKGVVHLDVGAGDAGGVR